MLCYSMLFFLCSQDECVVVVLLLYNNFNNSNYNNNISFFLFGISFFFSSSFLSFLFPLFQLWLICFLTYFISPPAIYIKKLHFYLLEERFVILEIPIIHWIALNKKEEMFCIGNKNNKIEMDNRLTAMMEKKRKRNKNKMYNLNIRNTTTK